MHEGENGNVQQLKFPRVKLRTNGVMGAINYAVETMKRHVQSSDNFELLSVDQIIALQR